MGDGFPVRNIFSYRDIAKDISPFLLLDYAGPMEFAPNPSAKRRGVGSHPHRGFETVTIVYQGEVEHRDSAGGGGVIGPGDVQWMTAASGLVHEERHGERFSKSGGLFEIVQLWVNLPKEYKMTHPRYQGIPATSIPAVQLPHNVGTVRVIAGEFADVRGPAKTFSPINLWDMRLSAGGKVVCKVPEGHTTLLLIVSGKVEFAGRQTLGAAELAVLEPQGEIVEMNILEDTKVLLLGGRPLEEPIVAHGPFVMSSEAEILQAIRDFNDGKMGAMDPIEGSD